MAGCQRLITEPDVGNDLVTEVVVMSPGYGYNRSDVTLVTEGGPCTVDWGDGEIQTDVFGVIGHSYAEAGTYSVRVWSESPLAFGVNGDTGLSNVIEVRSIGGNVNRITDYGLSRLPPRSLTGLHYSGPVLRLGERAFYKGRFTGLKSPWMFVDPGPGAFEGCEYLVDTDGFSAMRPSSARCFKGCTRLRSIVNAVDPDLKVIPDEMFHGCCLLESLDGLPGTVTEFGSKCFAGCTFCRSAQVRKATRDITSTVTLWNGLAVEIEDDSDWEVVVPKRITSIAPDCFDPVYVGDYLFGDDKGDIVRPNDINSSSNVTGILHRIYSFVRVIRFEISADEVRKIPGFPFGAQHVNIQTGLEASDNPVIFIVDVNGNLVYPLHPTE